MKVSIAFERNARLEPLIDGKVKAEGIDFDWDCSEPGGMFVRHLTKSEFDAFEFSLSHFFSTRTLPNPMYKEWTLAPIFTTKPIFMFRDMLVREASGISSLKDLKGKRFGIPDFSMTAGIWLRIILRKVYGLEVNDLTWINTRTPEKRQMHAMGLDHDTKTGVRLTNIEDLGKGLTPQKLIESGEVDAIISAAGVDVVEAHGVRLFGQDKGMEAYRELKEKVGMLPVNHGIVIDKRVIAKRPSLPRELMEACERSKAAAYASNPRARAVFPQLDNEYQRKIFGDDPYVFGLRANRKALELIAEQLVIDGMIAKVPEIDSLIVESLRDS